MSPVTVDGGMNSFQHDPRIDVKCGFGVVPQDDTEEALARRYTKTFLSYEDWSFVRVTTVHTMYMYVIQPAGIHDGYRPEHAIKNPKTWGTINF